MQNKKIILTNSIVTKDVITNENITLTKIKLSFVRIFPNKNQIVIGYDFITNDGIIGKHKEIIVDSDYSILDPSENNILQYIINNDNEIEGNIEE